MKRSRLAPYTLLSVVSTGLLLTWAGWFNPAPSHARTVEVRNGRSSEANSEAAVRHRRGGVNHWRGFVLQR